MHYEDDDDDDDNNNNNNNVDFQLLKYFCYKFNKCYATAFSALSGVRMSLKGAKFNRRMSINVFIPGMQSPFHANWVFS